MACYLQQDGEFLAVLEARYTILARRVREREMSEIMRRSTGIPLRWDEASTTHSSLTFQAGENVGGAILVEGIKTQLGKSGLGSKDDNQFFPYQCLFSFYYYYKFFILRIISIIT